jgi:uncharacterized membrane protein
MTGRVAFERAFLAAAVAWAALLPLATFVAAHGKTMAAGMTPAVAIYAVGSLICHQKPERSFTLWAVQMPVCARCTGIYLGAALSALALPFVRSAPGALARSRAATRIALVIAGLPTAATLLYEWSTGIMPSNAVRFGAGLPLGIAVAILIAGGIREGRAESLG